MASKIDETEYHKREFCKAKCELQELIYDYSIMPADLKQALRKSVCNIRCLKTAKEFMDWLQQKGYQILKSEVK